MIPSTASSKRVLAVLFALLIALALVPAPVAADERAGGTVVIDEGETVDDDLQAFGGTVVVRGTVTGNLMAVGGSVLIEGTVEGNVEGAAGSFQHEGTIDGDLEIGAGSVVIDGTVGGDAEIGAGDIRFTDDGRVEGDLTYDAESVTGLSQENVGGAITETEGLGAGFSEFFVPNWVSSLYFFLVNLLLGAVLLLLLPQFSAAVADLASGNPLRSGLVGLAVLIGGPILLGILAITIVGIPLMLLGLVLYLISLWVGAIYGAYGVGEWLLSFGDSESRWLAFLVGLIVVSLVGFVPVVGGIVQFVVLLLGLGALFAALFGGWRARRQRV